MTLFANPSIREYIDHLIGGGTPLPEGGVHGSVSPLAAALAGMSGSPRPAAITPFPAPSIRVGDSAPSPQGGGPRGLIGQSLTPNPSIGGGRGDLGGAALAAGIGKIGSGIEGALGDFAAKRAQQQTYADAMSSAPPRPAPFGAPPRPKPFGSQDSDAGTPPLFAQQSGGVSAGTPSAAPGGGVGIKNQIAQHIVDYAKSVGVNPNTALGIAYYEGLNRPNPLATNPDGKIGGVPNTAIGPYQLGTAGLGGQLGITATTPWKTQVEKSIDYMAAHGTGAWNSVGDFAGTHGNNSNTGPITARGAQIANQFGLAAGGSQSLAAQDAAQDRQQDASDSAAPSAPVLGGPSASAAPATGLQTGTYNGQPYTYETQPALGPQGMNDVPLPQQPQIDPLALALLQNQDPNAFQSLLGNFGFGGNAYG